MECLAQVECSSLHMFLSMRSEAQPLSIVSANRCDSASQKQAQTWQNPPNFRRFQDNLHQIQFSGCSALPESGRQSLPHPYSPLRAPAFFRISRNRVQASNPHVNKSFGMNLAESGTRNGEAGRGRDAFPAKAIFVFFDSRKLRFLFS